MIFITCFFFVLFVYACILAKPAAAFVCLFMSAFTLYGGRYIDRQSRGKGVDPNYVNTPCDGSEMLDVHQCETSGANFKTKSRSGKSKPDSKI